MAITFTKPAAQHVVTIATNKEPIVRLGVMAGGCSGYEYALDIIDIDNVKFNDRIFSSHGARIAVDPRSYLYINGTQVGYDNSIMGGGFTFDNPNAKRSCGCGTSFQA